MASRSTTTKAADAPKAPVTTTKAAGARKAPATTTDTNAANDTLASVLSHQGKAKANATAVTASITASTDAARNRSGLVKLGKGGLEAQVLDHMAAHPKSEFTPTDLARVLVRSGGAVANALAKFAKEGKVAQTSVRPRRYRLVGAKSARRTRVKA
ncbi:MAG TPA: hypothetical protein VNA57_08040 [Acidimicrobiales bacterium]|nr:hypothetical protein [Acidimicrobiales bacterium]